MLLGALVPLNARLSNTHISSRLVSGRDRAFVFDRGPLETQTGVTFADSSSAYWADDNPHRFKNLLTTTSHPIQVTGSCALGCPNGLARPTGAIAPATWALLKHTTRYTGRASRHVRRTGARRNQPVARGNERKQLFQDSLPVVLTTSLWVYSTSFNGFPSATVLSKGPGTQLPKMLPWMPHTFRWANWSHCCWNLRAGWRRPALAITNPSLGPPR